MRYLYHDIEDLGEAKAYDPGIAEHLRMRLLRKCQHGATASYHPVNPIEKS